MQATREANTETGERLPGRWPAAHPVRHCAVTIGFGAGRDEEARQRARGRSELCICEGSPIHTVTEGSVGGLAQQPRLDRNSPHRCGMLRVGAFFCGSGLWGRSHNSRISLGDLLRIAFASQGAISGHEGAFQGTPPESGAFEPAQTRSSSDFQRLCSLLFGILAATQKKQMGKTISIWPSTNRF